MFPPLPPLALRRREANTASLSGVSTGGLPLPVLSELLRHTRAVVTPLGPPTASASAHDSDVQVLKRKEPTHFYSLYVLVLLVTVSACASL